MHEITTHGDNYIVCPYFFFFYIVYLIFMSCMEWIVFCNNSGCFHKIAPQKKYVVLPYSNIEKLEIQGGVAYNEDKLLKGKGIFMPVPRGLL